jgi:hypothetical protein
MSVSVSLVRAAARRVLWCLRSHRVAWLLCDCLGADEQPEPQRPPAVDADAVGAPDRAHGGLVTDGMAVEHFGDGSMRLEDVANNQDAAMPAISANSRKIDGVSLKIDVVKKAVSTVQASLTRHFRAVLVACVVLTVAMVALHQRLTSLSVDVGNVANRVDDLESRVLQVQVGPVPFPNDVIVCSDAQRFVGRDGQLAQLQAGFQNSTDGMRHAVVGMAGVGKTRLAKEYSCRNRLLYPRGVFWIEADSISSLYGGYRQMLSQLKLFDGTPDDSIDSDETAMHRAHAWLGRGGGWLLVLNNLDRPEMLRKSPVRIPVVAGSHLLVTTRAVGDRLHHVGMSRRRSQRQGAMAATWACCPLVR